MKDKRKLGIVVSSLVLVSAVLVVFARLHYATTTAVKNIKGYQQVFGEPYDFPEITTTAFSGARSELAHQIFFTGDERPKNTVMFSETVPVYEIVYFEQNSLDSANGNPNPVYTGTGYYMEIYDNVKTNFVRQGSTIHDEVSFLIESDKQKKSNKTFPLTEGELKRFREGFDKYNANIEYFKAYKLSATRYYGFSLNGEFDRSLYDIEPVETVLGKDYKIID